MRKKKIATAQSPDKNKKPAAAQVGAVTRKDLDEDQQQPLPPAGLTSRANVNDKIVGDFKVEVASHPDPSKEWSVMSATPTCDDDSEKEKVLYTIKTLLQAFLDDPESRNGYFYQMRDDTPYIKTPFFRFPLQQNHGLLNDLIRALDAEGFRIALQLYRGHGVFSFLTSIHQDGGNAHDRLQRIVVRFGGETVFMKSSNASSVFYAADANNKMRATLATANAFCGQCNDEDGSNNGVHHSGSKGDDDLPSILFQVERKVDCVGEQDLLACIQVIHDVITAHWKKSSEKVRGQQVTKLTQELHDLGPRFFEHVFGNGNLRSWGPNTLHRSDLPQEYQDAFPERINFTIKFFRERQALAGRIYNPNTDYLILPGGHNEPGYFNWFVHNSKGNELLQSLLRRRIPHNYNKMETSDKTQFKVECVLEFHELSNGGWFFRKEGHGWGDDEVKEFNVHRLAWKEVVKGSHSAMARTIETVRKQMQDNRKRAVGEVCADETASRKEAK